jgi:WhiB family redox-sensing transcriptional regulator
VSAIPHFLDHATDTPCRQHPHLFVDSKRTTPLKDDTAAAKELCDRCPVRTQCLEYAIVNDFRDGIWGGLTAAERDDLARSRAH